MTCNPNFAKVHARFIDPSLIILFFSFFLAIGHKGPSEGAPRTEPQDGGAPAGPFRPMYALRSALAAGGAPKGGDVQEQAQARPRAGVHGPAGKDATRVLRLRAQQPRWIRPRALR